jgi:hypothetical protein
MQKIKLFRTCAKSPFKYLWQRILRHFNFWRRSVLDIHGEPKIKIKIKFKVKDRFCASPILLILTLLAFSSCKVRPGEPIDDFKEDLESASPDFKLGWLDGCESGMKSGTNNFYQTIYKIKQDGFKMAYSPDYQVAWNNSYWYCFRKDWTNQQNATLWSSMFGGLR